jgi:hypothetical protein
MRIGLVLLVALPLAACAAEPVYEDPKRASKVDKLREARDLCLIQNVSRFDNASSNPARVGDEVALACADQTTRLVELAVPYPSQQARAAFEKEARLRATGYVITARRIESDAINRQRQPGEPQQQPQLLYPLGMGVL